MYPLDDPRYPDYRESDDEDGRPGDSEDDEDDNELQTAMEGAQASADAENVKSPENERAKKSSEPATAHRGRGSGSKRQKKGWGKSGGEASTIYGPKSTAPQGPDAEGGGLSSLSARLQESQASLKAAAEQHREDQRRKEMLEEARSKQQHSDMMNILNQNQQLMQDRERREELEKTEREKRHYDMMNVLNQNQQMMMQMMAGFMASMQNKGAQ